MDQQALIELRKKHSVGFKGIWATYPRKQMRRSVTYPGIATLLFVVLYAVTRGDAFKLIQDLVSVTFTVVPCLLGFLLGGYTILIGFGNPELLRATTRTSIKSPVSLFQTMSSVFAACITMQVVCLLLAGAWHLVSQVEVSINPQSTFLVDGRIVLNYLALSSLLFALSYAVTSLPSILVNVFNFAQVYHFRLSQQRINEEETIQKEPQEY